MDSEASEEDEYPVGLTESEDEEKENDSSRYVSTLDELMKCAYIPTTLVSFRVAFWFGVDEAADQREWLKELVKLEKKKLIPKDSAQRFQGTNQAQSPVPTKTRDVKPMKQSGELNATKTRDVKPIKQSSKLDPKEPSELNATIVAKGPKRPFSSLGLEVKALLDQAFDEHLAPIKGQLKQIEARMSALEAKKRQRSH
ncbi:hypothetical protein Poli38472_013247 [Pythium oligandrum]|uniref:Uncharacterized protein n=1 Tax=Pythium oligandrum TaxID=41045 RepID=A0A8K1C2N7_PYTOL|nr:hypothetical protein Poli38472_013247 [Pythium oligandrum]|eukprot:TMW55356.1 hypothetical protein Poli38472_013247 [Pythium oligandrum]